MTERDRVARRVTIVGAIVNILLAALKAVAGVITASASLIADAIHSIGDLASDFVVYIAILLGSREADENHQYGHRRYETLASLIVGLMIIAAGIGLGYEMINRIQDSSSWEVPGQLAMAAAAVSILVKEILYRYTYSAGVKQNHPLMQANAFHHRTDALSSLVVLIGLIATEFGITVGDLAAALVVSFMLARAGLKIVYEALLEVSEAGVDPETYSLMEKTIRETDGVIDMHLLRTKTIGGEIFAESHAQVNPYISVTQGHEIAHRIVERVEAVVPALKELTVHIDPEYDEHDSPELPNCSQLEEKIRDLRLKGVPGIERANVQFDDKEGEYYLSTIGSNLSRVSEIETIDRSRTYTNNIIEIFNYLGIEAARQAIINELESTLLSARLEVDVRHLLMVADVMTSEGEVRAIGRHGVSGTKHSILARAAFEVTVNHLLKAGIIGETDRLTGVAENIIVGQPISLGTGSVELFYIPEE